MEFSEICDRVARSLSRLSRHSKKGVSADEIAKETGIDKTTVATALRELADRGAARVVTFQVFYKFCSQR